MKTLLILAGLIAIELSAAPSTRAQNPPEDAARIAQLPKAERLAAEPAKELEAKGAKVFGLSWDKKRVAVSDRGFQVITDGVTTLSYRPAGNAYFVQTAKTGLAEKKPFDGPNEKLISRGKEILKSLNVNSRELAEVTVLQQFTTAGRVDPATHMAKVEPPKKDRRSLLVNRVVDGIPVWNSKLALDLDDTGRIASLEMSWPAIAPKVMEEALELHKMIESGYHAPEVKGAKMQSVQAGILHSPAASFIDEQVAAIRVIYAPEDSKLGMKPVVYLGANGRPVQIPRQLNPREEAPVKPRPEPGAPIPR
jgi:hypothetical protein